jgi:hypothetical protein
MGDIEFLTSITAVLGDRARGYRVTGVEGVAAGE